MSSKKQFPSVWVWLGRPWLSRPGDLDGYLLSQAFDVDHKRERKACEPTHCPLVYAGSNFSMEVFS